MFTITHIDEQHTTLENEHAKVDMDTKDFHRHFYVAYAITIHKSQGQTYNKPYTIHEWNKLDKRLRYVALSRATKKDYINIMI
jgi:ATP-dependent exoDNAse (exonuclease V) alpha subunit